jgi:hypothetical protein
MNRPNLPQIFEKSRFLVSKALYLSLCGIAIPFTIVDWSFTRNALDLASPGQTSHGQGFNLLGAMDQLSPFFGKYFVALASAFVLAGYILMTVVKLAVDRNEGRDTSVSGALTASLRSYLPRGLILYFIICAGTLVLGLPSFFSVLFLALSFPAPIILLTAEKKRAFASLFAALSLRWLSGYGAGKIAYLVHAMLIGFVAILLIALGLAGKNLILTADEYFGWARDGWIASRSFGVPDIYLVASLLFNIYVAMILGLANLLSANFFLGLANPEAKAAA